MKKSLLSIAILAVLPFGAMAENISGAMYASPATADTNHPAPMVYYRGPYGRENIDTMDQDHIASTAYVKGAYNSAIAAVNTLDSAKQEAMIVLVDNEEYDVPDRVANDFGDFDDDTYPGQMVTGRAVLNEIDARRVTVYTTWEDDTENGTTQVELSTAQ